ncbi:MAG: outer membrane beta-barrel protein, partial [Candidatus Omnitrophica bacterium]|nr:outer membrane beta-barrel protein [Candidatus Omnitrophota bacterium]
DWRYLPSQLEYSHKDSLYEKRYRESNTSEDRVSLTNYIRLLPKTDFLFSYDYDVSARPDVDGADGTAHTFWGGVRGKLTSKVGGTMKVGYKFRENEDKTNINTEVVQADLEYRMTERLSHGISVSRNTDTTTLSDETWVETNKFELGSTYVPPFGHERMKFGSFIRFTNSGYDTGRKDDVYEGGVNVRYAFRKQFSVGLDYVYFCQSSDIRSASYKNNVVTLKLEKDF